MGDDSLIQQTAHALVAGLKGGELSPHDLLDALEARIDEVNEKVNALVTVCFERARKHADSLLAKPVEERGVLAGMPVPIKDLSDVAGVRSTMGSRIFEDTVPDASDLLVEHLEANGGIIYAKSNTPEFGAGANTFNDVFGATLNPWDLSKSAAGSSGGAAVSLATGMAWLAHGSDMGGSLRNPASFNSICGMRPSPGRVACSRAVKVDGNLGQEGPMARNVQDLALLFDAMCGAEAADPVSKPAPAVSFVDQCNSGWKPRKVALSLDLGITPVDPEVAEIVEGAARRLEAEGVVVEHAHPNLGEAHECFQTLRALSFATGMKPLLEAHRDKLKPEVIWNIEKGLALTADEVVRAEHQRAAMFQRTLRFFEEYDLLLTPATIVAPFPVEKRYVETCNGHKFETYIDWLAIAYAITNVCCPALSVPAGFTKQNLPVGIQIVARPQCDGEALAGGRLLEQLMKIVPAVPIDPRG